MTSHRILLSVAGTVLLAANAVIAQPASDQQERHSMAERILASKETPGREFDAKWREVMVTKLERETVASLQARLISGIIADALGDSTADMTYTTLQQPCRVIDTRQATAGALAGGTQRNFFVVGATGFNTQGGNAGGCGIPAGSATAAMINFVSVSPGGAGNLKGSAFPNPIPGTGSVINYAALTPPLNIANGVVFPLCDSTINTCAGGDVTLFANGSGTHVVADVLGYFTKFPKEQARSFTVSTRASGGPTVGIACTNFTSVTVNAPVAGTVLVRSNVTISVPHVNGVTDRVIVSVAGAPTTCDGSATGESQQTYVDSAEGNGSRLRSTSVLKQFNVLAGSNTFYVNGILTQGAAGQTFSAAGIEATFHPN